MHNLFLGELRHHCMEVWGIDIKGKSPDELKLEPHTPEEQRKWLDFLVNALQKGLRNRIMKPRKGYLVALAEFNGALPPSGKLTKADFAHSLLVWVCSNGPGAPLDSIKIPPVLATPTNDFHLVKNPYDISKHRVLNHTLLSQIRNDIATTILPSWMERAPRTFGSASHGKLKADQWRTVCTVNLVVTLTRIWGSPTATAKDKVLLLNFLHLVCAVDLASRRTMSDARARRFDQHILKYLETLKTIFDHHLVPNHHLSLHLEECLRAFGPVHAWWAFPFERFNGLLARFNTNYKPQEMPLTFLRYFYIGTGLRGLIEGYPWPDSDIYQRMLASFGSAFQDYATLGNHSLFHSNNTEVDPVSYDDKREVLLPRDVYDGILMRVSTPTAPFASMYSSTRTRTPRLYGRAVEVTSHTHNGVTFATAKAQLRNSFIVFEHPSSASGPHFPGAGQISSIFLHSRATEAGRLIEPMFIVDVYKALSSYHAQADPYRPYKDLQTRLFYRTFEEKQVVLTMQDIRAHFAAYFYVPDEIAAKCVVVRSLDRVRGSVDCDQTNRDTNLLCSDMTRTTETT
ncbi:hypothetical protein LXA43DRAFT_902409 [Ganoderma leucocontextum]|nr:hypothetical protein LXA43DRAFT_902409 [Ganoderma leucocontextum]